MDRITKKGNVYEIDVKDATPKEIEEKIREVFKRMKKDFPSREDRDD